MNERNSDERLYVPEPAKWLKFTSQRYCSDQPLNVRTVERGIILPVRPKVEGKLYQCRGGVCDGDFNFVAGYKNHEQGKGFIKVDESYRVEAGDLRQCDEDVIFGGVLIYHFGHFMIECISRLWYLVKNPSARKIVFVSMGQWQFKPWVFEFMKLFGLPEDRIVILEEPTQFRSIIVPDQAVYITSGFSKEFLTPYRRLLENVPPLEGVGKIFLSRGKSLKSARTFYNGEYFEEFYRRHGFKIIAPEELSLADQIATIAGAEEVVTYLGTLSHWALFCKPNTKFTILAAVDSNDMLPTIARQSLINEASGVDWRIVNVDRNFLISAHTSGPIMLGSTEHWRQYVRDQFGETLDDEVIPSALMSNYIRHWCRFFADAEPRRINSLKNIYRRLDSLQAQLPDSSARSFDERSSLMDDNQLKRRLYVPNFDHWQRMCTKKYFSDRSLDVQTVERGIILPARPIDAKDPYHCQGGVCDSDLKFVAGYNNLPPPQKNGAYCLDEAYSIERSEIEQSAEDVIFGGILVCHFGHFLTDCLSRMWYVAKNPDDERKVVFLMIKTTELQKLQTWVYQLLDLIGLPEDRIVILEKPTQFKSVTIPEQAVRVKHDFTREFLTPFEHIKSRVRPSNVKKIFLTRSPDVVSYMHLCNQKYFEEFFKRRGFTVIAPETLSIVDQIALVSGAEEVATFLGTLAHWSLFSHKGAKWTFINRVDDIFSRQCIINEAVGIDWCFVSAAMNFLYAEQGGGACLLGPTEHWQRYIIEHHGRQLDPNVRLPRQITDDYIERWCKYFYGAPNFKLRVASVENLYSRIAILERQVECKRPVLCFDVHSAQRGWLPTNVEGDISGFYDKEWSLQAIKIKFNEPFCNVRYSIYYPDSGWTSEVANGQQAGVVGKNKAFYGISIRIDNLSGFDVLYRIHSFNGNWSRWRRNGEKIAVRDVKLNALQIKLEPRVGKEQSDGR